MRRIIGCGNPFRRDDGVGVAVARRLRGGAAGDAEVVEASGEAVDLLERFRGADRVVVIDAMRSGLPPGTIRRFEPLRGGFKGGGRPPRAGSTSSPAVLGADTARSGVRPFAQYLSPYATGMRQASAFASGHGLGVPQAVALAVRLGIAPKRLRVYGIEGADFTDGEGLSPAVEAAAEKLALLLGARHA